MRGQRYAEVVVQADLSQVGGPIGQRAQDNPPRQPGQTFEYIIKFYDLHRRQIQVMLMNNGGFQANQITDSDIFTTENEVISTIV